MFQRPSSPRGASAVFLLAATIGATAVPASAQTLIDTVDGPVQGQLNDGTREFLGIPYAAPPVGSLRFSPPAAVTPWVSPLDATTWPTGCSQLPVLTNGDTRIENEDCLYLNVWTPDPAPVEPVPVMVWFHGGSNVSGSISDFIPFPGFDTIRLYDGHSMSKKGAVVVTVNYRLNVFGFLGLPELAAEDPGYPYAGNQGLLDQRKALQWVQANAAAFGGDPNNVTIYGESAGSFDVCAHVVSPMSAGLFHRAISQSGGCTVGVNTEAEAEAAADTLAEVVGCDLAPDRLACMRALPLATLLDAGPAIELVGEGTNLSISVDGGFLPELPIETFNRGAVPPIPYLMGSNGDEGTLFFIGSPDLTPAEYSAELLDRFGAWADEVEALYPGTSDANRRDQLIRAFGDASLVCSTHDVARRHSEFSGAKTYLYNFTRVPDLDFISLLELGSFHALEVAYVFGTGQVEGLTEPWDTTLSGHMQDYWSSFARKGKPKSKGAKGWPRFKTKSYAGIFFGNEILKFKGYNRARCDFWSGLYDLGVL